MRKFLFIALVALLAVSCSNRKEQQVVLTPNQGFKLIPVTERNATFAKFLREKGEFEWNWASDALLHSALADNNDGVLVVGYKPADFQEGGDVNVGSEPWGTARENLIADILATYEKYGMPKERKDIISRVHARHPFFKVKVEMIELVSVIRQSPYYRYAEPDTYIYTPTGNSNFRVSDIGCGSPETNPATGDYLKASDNTYYSWHHTIPNKEFLLLRLIVKKEKVLKLE